MQHGEGDHDGRGGRLAVVVPKLAFRRDAIDDTQPPCIDGPRYPTCAALWRCPVGRHGQAPSRPMRGPDAPVAISAAQQMSFCRTILLAACAGVCCE